MKTTKVQLNFPSQFSKYVYGVQTIEFEGDRVLDLVEKLDHSFGHIKERLLDENGNVRPYINLFIGKKSIKNMDGLDSVINEGETISLLLSRAGG